MLAVYHWHPHEFSALLWGLAGGVVGGFPLGVFWVEWRQRRRVRAAVARAQRPRSRA